MVAAEDIVAAGEIAERLGWSVACVCNWMKRARDFPQPIAILRMGRIYNWQEVQKWAKAHGKE